MVALLIMAGMGELMRVASSPMFGFCSMRYKRLPQDATVAQHDSALNHRFLCETFVFPAQVSYSIVAWFSDSDTLNQHVCVLISCM